jgi:uncharacterized protein (TIGR02452 family)
LKVINFFNFKKKKIKKELHESSLKSIYYTEKMIKNLENSFKNKFLTKILVQKKDCIDVGLELLEKNLNPIILNCANAYHPGGGFLHGSGAQEENIHRRS